MTNRLRILGSGGNAANGDLPRPVPVIPVAKPRTAAKINNANSSSSSALTPHYDNCATAPKAAPSSSLKSPGSGSGSGSGAKGAIPKESDTMTKTKAILNEAADAVAKSFAKQTQGINKGKNV